jgi:FkbM family methyltransferase
MPRVIPLGVKEFAYQYLPPRLLKYQIAWRNYRRGEPEIRLLRELVDPGRATIDIGAYLGAYTFFLRRLARHVHAFEPQPACAAFLERAFKSGVTVYPVALAERVGSAFLQTTGTGPFQAATLAESASGTVTPVRLQRLDDFAFDNIGFIKLDAEGAEQRILSGAVQTLERERPVLLVEMEQRHGADLPGQMAWLAEHGYRGSFWFEGRERPLIDFSIERMQQARLTGAAAQPYVNNFIFRPR